MKAYMTPKNPIFKSILGTSWDALPRALKKHYSNRAYTHDCVTVEGELDIFCTGPFRWFSSILWTLGLVPPVTQKKVPVTVHFKSTPYTEEFHLDRVFHLKDRPIYHFRSFMAQIQNNQVIEVMRYGFYWRHAYSWSENRIRLRHKGYGLKVFGCRIPLPLTFLFGGCETEEWAIDEDSFAMRATITHPLWGKIYEYKGTFKITETEMDLK